MPSRYRESSSAKRCISVCVDSISLSTQFRLDISRYFHFILSLSRRTTPLESREPKSKGLLEGGSFFPPAFLGLNFADMNNLCASSEDHFVIAAPYDVAVRI